MPATRRGAALRYLRGLAAPIFLWAAFVGYLFYLYGSPFGRESSADESSVQEWIQEAQIGNKTLPALMRDYLGWARQGGVGLPEEWQEEIQTFLKSLGEPTKRYAGQLPFFPVIYRIELKFLDPPGPALPRSIVWDSEVPRHPSQFRRLTDFPLQDGVVVSLEYQLHAYDKRQQDEQAAALRVRWMAGLAAAATALAFVWIYLQHRREQERDRQRVLAEQQINRAESMRLREELRRQEAETRQEEYERKLLEQRLAAQESEQKLLELKSQLFANIGIMAGSYAHNIKNLLVRPNDLLRRCLEADGLSDGQQHMLAEVRQTLGTVTERLQQILHTVRRDPGRAELTRIDLNRVAADLHRTWEHLAREKWKVTLTVELWPEPLVVEGDLSHLQQAVENLLFNARDATFEMRNHLREQAHSRDAADGLEGRRQALIAAAAWKGHVVLRTRRDGDRAAFEVQDNGIGMTEEVRRHCTETHFSTKRNNALYEGYNAGMGLGLSFVVVVLQHQHATLDIASAPLQGTTFRINFPLAEPAQADPVGGRSELERG